MRFPILFGAVILLASCASGKQAKPALPPYIDLKEAVSSSIKSLNEPQVG